MYAHVLVSDIHIVLTCLEKGSPFYYLDVSSNVFSLMSVFVVLADMLFDSNHFEYHCFLRSIGCSIGQQECIDEHRKYA